MSNEMRETAGQQLRKMADEYESLTGENVFAGVEHRGGSTVYLFSFGTYWNAVEAVWEMTKRLNDARAKNRENWDGQ